MSQDVRRNLSLIQAYNQLPPKAQKIVLQCAGPSLTKGLCEIVYNTLTGRIPLSPKQHTKIKRDKKLKTRLRSLGFQKNLSLRKKRNLLVQSGGFFSAILPIAASVLGAILSSK